MFVAGTSTRHPWGKSLKPCWESLEVGSTISRLNQTLTQQFDTWRASAAGALAHGVCRALVHFSIRPGEKVDSTIILTALGVDGEGNKEVLALRVCAQESKEGWLSLLQDLRSRGATKTRCDRD